MELSKVIIKPVLTEKALALREEGIWSFFVHPQASKGMVKKAAEEFLGVHSLKVRTINLKPKTKNLWRKRQKVTLNRKKKALFWLSSGEKIKNV